MEVTRDVPLLVKAAEITEGFSESYCRVGDAVSLTMRELSFPGAWISTIYFYACEASRADLQEAATEEEEEHCLKASLARCLAVYTPLAGRFRDQDHGFQGGRGPELACTNEGVPFVCATATCRLPATPAGIDELLASGGSQELVPELVQQRGRLDGSPALAVQLTRFSCGACSVGVAWHHLAGDGHFMAAFTTAWAEVARLGCLSVPPVRPSADHLTALYQRGAGERDSDRWRELFKARDGPGGGRRRGHPLHNTPPEREAAVGCRRFHIARHQLDLTRQQCEKQAQGGAGKLSSNDVLCAALWKAAANTGYIASEQTAVHFPVEARSRVRPALPPTLWGSAAFRLKVAAPRARVLESPVSELSTIIRKAMNESATPECIKSQLSWLEDHGQRQAPLQLHVKQGELDISSWRSFPLYGVQFREALPPVHVATTDLPFPIVFILPASDGGANISLSFPVAYLDAMVNQVKAAFQE